MRIYGDVQLEGNYFTPKGVSYVYHVGHVGFSELIHFYWPLFYQILISKNQELVKKNLESGNETHYVCFHV